jgi:hypothetical protein
MAKTAIGRFLGALVFSAIFLVASRSEAQTSTGFFVGPDSGQGLDLSGTFLYSVQFSTNGARTVSGLAFSDYTDVAGLVISTHFHVDNWGTKPEYGSSASANALEDMMQDIVYYSLADFSLSLPNLTVGSRYKLQLLVSENYYDGINFLPNQRRYQSLAVEGTQVLTNMDSLLGSTWTAAPNTHTKGVVITHEFVAGDSTMNLDFIRGSTPDTAPIVNALTVEAVPEPSAMLLVAAGACGLFLLRRRG